ncbi:MAG: gas vesicle protein GvpG [Methylovirgula sp.]
MLLIDDIIAAPFRGLLFVFKEINKAVQKEREAEEKRLMAELSALHHHLESGTLSEAEFEAQEAKLLQKLDDLNGNGDGRDNEQA